MITVPAPTGIHGRMLAAELEAAGYLDVQVVLAGNVVEVHGKTAAGAEIGDRSQGKIAALVASHGPRGKAEQDRLVQARTDRAARITQIRTDAKSTDPVVLQRVVATLVDELFGSAT